MCSCCSLNFYLLGEKEIHTEMFFSMSKKIKRHLYQQSLFSAIFVLHYFPIFPQEISTQKFASSMGTRGLLLKLSKHVFKKSLLTRNSQNFKKRI